MIVFSGPQPKRLGTPQPDPEAEHGQMEDVRAAAAQELLHFRHVHCAHTRSQLSDLSVRIKNADF